MTEAIGDTVVAAFDHFEVVEPIDGAFRMSLISKFDARLAFGAQYRGWLGFAAHQSQARGKTVSRRRTLAVQRRFFHHVWLVVSLQTFPL